MVGPGRKAVHEPVRLFEAAAPRHMRLNGPSSESSSSIQAIEPAQGALTFDR
jgi:hypothetical protein